MDLKVQVLILLVHQEKELEHQVIEVNLEHFALEVVEVVVEEMELLLDLIV